MFLVRKLSGHDAGKLYAMKVLRKAAIVAKAKTTEHTRTERAVLEHVRQSPFLVTLHYAFQTDSKLHLILGMRMQEESGGDMGVWGGGREVGCKIMFCYKGVGRVWMMKFMRQEDCVGNFS